MAIDFPNSPTNNQVFIDGASGNQYIYDSANTKWKSYSLQYVTPAVFALDYGSVADSIAGTAFIDYGSVA